MNDDIISFNTESLVNKDLNELKNPPQPKFKIYDILPETSDILTKKIPEFLFDGEVNPITLASELVETAKKNNAYGLSANQCGLNYRVFVMGYDNEYLAFFNPKITSYKENHTTHEVEGCLSFPGLLLSITRPNKINVQYQDMKGNIKTATYEGLTSRIFQHELDHLDGISFTQRAKPFCLKRAKEKRQKTIKRYSNKFFSYK